MKLILPAVVFLVISPALFLAGPDEPQDVRVLVRIEPRDIGKRSRDEMPAEFRLAAPDIPANRNLDPASLQVVRWDIDAQKPVGTPLPLRWYDNAIAYDFPDCEQNVHATDGVNLKYTRRPRWGDY